MSPDLILKSRRTILPSGLRPASILVKDGNVQAVLGYDFHPENQHNAPTCNVIDAKNLVLMPALVDTHVHVNEPGRTDWEGFRSATRAAAAGGIATIIDMPLNSIPATTSVTALWEKERAADNQCWVDCGFWGGVIPGNLPELEPMLEAGVWGFKVFLIHSGIDDFPSVGEGELRCAMKILARYSIPLLAHAECASSSPPVEGDCRSYRTYLESRPKSWENEAVRLLARLCLETGCRVHIVHLSSAEALPLIQETRRAGGKLTAETCPHYLFFGAEDIPEGRTEFKCSPPIREKKNRQKLWEALGEGWIDFIASDHSPCPVELKNRKEGDFLKAWGGISSLQMSLPAVWTAARRHGFGIEDIAHWMCENPARFAGLDSFKGRIAPNHSADLVVWDPEASFTPEPEHLEHRHPMTPYAGHRLFGKIEMTFLRGIPIYERGRFKGPQGRLLKKSHELHGTL
jgi:allantoinase